MAAEDGRQFDVGCAGILGPASKAAASPRPSRPDGFNVETRIMKHHSSARESVADRPRPSKLANK